MSLNQFDKDFAWMSISNRFLELRRLKNITQQQMADLVGIHVTQVKRYEAGEAQPSIEILKKVALAFNVSTDWLLFEDGEREPEGELKLKFEAVAKMDEEERRSITSILDAMILKHQTKKFFVS